MRLGLLYDKDFDERLPNVISDDGDSILVRYYRSQNIVKIPLHATNELSYLTGIIIGDGTVHSPVKRNRGGYHWKITITGEKEYTDLISDIVFRLFSYKPKVTKDKRRANCFRISINSAIIHRFFNKAIGIPWGKKKYSYMPEMFCKEPKLFAHFLAGIIDSDGYICKRYIAIIQKDRRFLERISKLSKEMLGINFRKPYVNRRIGGEIKGWFITVGKNEEKSKVLRTVPIKYKIKGP